MKGQEEERKEKKKKKKEDDDIKGRGRSTSLDP
jgi:hypothetical protein